MLKCSSVYCLVIAMCAQANAAENDAYLAPQSNSLQTSTTQDDRTYSLRMA